jgi:hypothetical protein
LRIFDFRFWIDSTDKSRGGYHQEIRLSKRLRWPAPNAPNVSEILEIAFIDELQFFMGKKYKLGLRTTVNLFRPGLLAWVLGDRFQD